MIVLSLILKRTNVTNSSLLPFVNGVNSEGALQIVAV